jgi:DNA-binding response OmpR family regulator
MMTLLRASNTLLIAEDDVLIATVLKDELEDAGYHILDLTDRVADALEIAKASAPNLALVNIDLADGDDGVELADALKTLGIPVLLISGQVSRARSARTVAIASLPKPYDAADMVLAVDYLLARLQGKASPPKPTGLEVFDEDGFELAAAN